MFLPKPQTNSLNLSYPTMLLQLYRLNFSFAVLWVVFFIVSAVSRRVTQLLVCLGFALVSETTHKGRACALIRLLGGLLRRPHSFTDGLGGAACRMQGSLRPPKHGLVLGIAPPWCTHPCTALRQPLARRMIRAGRGRALLQHKSLIAAPTLYHAPPHTALP